MDVPLKCYFNASVVMGVPTKHFICIRPIYVLLMVYPARGAGGGEQTLDPGLSSVFHAKEKQIPVQEQTPRSD